jgi:ABC-type proline/glycine betaine transport system substrate-binding protein
MSLKLKAVLASAVLALSLSSIPSVHAAKRLTAPDPDWTGGVVTCRVLQYIMENEMGYKIKTITMPSGAGVAEGIRNGDLDFACETWPTYNATKEKYVKEYGGDGSVINLGPTGVVGLSGYFAPRYMIEGDSSRGIPASTPNLKSYKDLNQYKHMFKSLESGDKGNLIGCPVAAWECDDQKRLDGLGVDFYAQALGSETAHWAEIQAKYKRGEPFLAYAWAPHWIHAALDLVEVGLPPYDADKWPATNWAEDHTFNRGSPALVKDHPEVEQLIRNQNLTNLMQSGMIYEIDVKKREVDEVVEEWMEANESTWKQWIP